MIVGADTSTSCVALCRIDPETGRRDQAWTWRFQGAKGTPALQRMMAFQGCFASGLSIWQGVSELFIEQQVGGATSGYWERTVVAGAVVREAALAGCKVTPLMPGQWRKLNGWPGNMRSAEAKERAIEEARLLGYEMTEDQAEAFFIARAGMKVIEGRET